MGVDYVHGHAESTGGRLWVVGTDPELFEYFLPERWRTTPQARLEESHETYLTTSKDNARLVWRVSRVGERPEIAAFGTEGFRVLARGFNSPFEEVAIACWLRRRGLRVTLPRAIYRTGHRSQLAESLFEHSRYDSHQAYHTPDGEPLLERRRNYITVWDLWTAPEWEGGAAARPVSQSMNLDQAVERGFLAKDEARSFIAEYRDRLTREGIDVLRMAPVHLLVAIGPDQKLLREEDGRIATCLCDFQYLALPESLREPA
jgi:hypothetical protein